MKGNNMIWHKGEGFPLNTSPRFGKTKQCVVELSWRRRCVAQKKGRLQSIFGRLGSAAAECSIHHATRYNAATWNHEMASERARALRLPPCAVGLGRLGRWVTIIFVYYYNRVWAFEEEEERASRVNSFRDIACLIRLHLLLTCCVTQDVVLIYLFLRKTSMDSWRNILYSKCMSNQGTLLLKFSLV